MQLIWRYIFHDPNLTFFLKNYRCIKKRVMIFIILFHFRNRIRLCPDTRLKIRVISSSAWGVHCTCRLISLYLSKKIDIQTALSRTCHLYNVCSLTNVYLFRYDSFYAVIIFKKLNLDEKKYVKLAEMLPKRSTFVDAVYTRGQSKRNIDKQHIKTCDISAFF